MVEKEQRKKLPGSPHYPLRLSLFSSLFNTPSPPPLSQATPTTAMKLPFFSSSSPSNSNGDSKNTKKRKTHKQPQQQRSLSFSSSSSSNSESSPAFRRPRPPFIGRNASCLDPEYCPAPPATHSLFPRRHPDGKIPTSDLEAALCRLGSADAAELLAEVDRDGDGRVALEDLLHPPADDDEELRVAFAVYDANGDGKISPEELCDVFRRLGDGSCSVSDCRRMIGRVDSDGDGLVCFRDFARMMSSAVLTG